MANDSNFYAVLRAKRERLIKEVEALDVLLADDQDTAQTSKPTGKDSVTSKRVAEGTSRGDMTWEAYILHLIEKFGGKGIKTSQIMDYAIKANPDDSVERINDAIRGNISRMAKEGKRIFTHKGTTRKEGYKYDLIK